MAWLEKLPLWVVPALLIGVPLLVAGAAQVAPEAVGDNIVWKYYWGPIHADEASHKHECLLPDGSIRPTECTVQSGGVETASGYNLVNTASWALLLGVCILGAAQMLARHKAVMDTKLIVGAAGWVVAGSVFHVLEDIKLFDTPLAYFFITPPIYLMFAAGGVATFLLGSYLRRVAEQAGLERALQKLWLWAGVMPVFAYLLLWLQPWDQVRAYVNPIWVAVFALIAYALASWRFRRIGRIDPNELVGFMSIGWILLSIAYVVQWMQAPWWELTYPGVPCAVPQGCEVSRPITEALLAPFLAALVALVVAGIARGLSRDAVAKGKPAKWAPYAWPINILLIWSQLVDGFATALGIDYGKTIGATYDEKHVLSANIISWTEGLGEKIGFQPMVDYPTFFGFLPIKLLVSLLVVYAIDVSNPKDAQRYPTLIGLVKFAIIMVGLGPGVRDFVRMGLGV